MREPKAAIYELGPRLRPSPGLLRANGGIQE